jgi:glutamine synthetase type III
MDKKSFQECKELLKLQGKSLSEEISDFILRKLAELKGTETKVDSTRKLEDLKAKYDDVVIKTVKLERQLQTSPHFREATDMLLKLGLRKDLSNVDEVVPKFVSVWKGDESFMHQFINLTELAANKKRVLQALTVMRSGPVKSEPSEVPNGTVENSTVEPGT